MFGNVCFGLLLIYLLFYLCYLFYYLFYLFLLTLEYCNGWKCLLFMIFTGVLNGK